MKNTKLLIAVGLLTASTANASIISRATDMFNEELTGCTDTAGTVIDCVQTEQEGPDLPVDPNDHTGLISFPTPQDDTQHVGTFSHNDIPYGDTVYWYQQPSDPVSTVPLPAAVWLFGVGLIGLVGVARRKSA